MKRRTFGVLAGTTMLALAGTGRRAFAQAADTSLLQTTLTPFGSERAGNAAGTIPAWSGGLTEIPAGIDWDPTRTLPPDFFASDAMLYEVNGSNMAQYANLLTDGLKDLITTRGFSLKVYPTRRTHAAPQFVYDNIKLNVSRAKVNPAGGRLGFTGGWGGIPFPFLDSDPLVAGTQLQWNHEARWLGKYLYQLNAAYTVSNGQLILVNTATVQYIFPYYAADSIQAYNGNFYEVKEHTVSPSNIAGGELVNYESSDPLVQPNIAWQVLPGQGRVRKAPEVEYDTPASYADGIINYDEYFGFGQSLDEYDWKFLGKQEMLIPYNNNKIFHTSALAAHGPKFLDPDVLRWELHRVNIVEATLHPGRRNVLARRKLYYDEDTSVIGIVDAWDGSGNLVRHTQLANANFPNLPGTVYNNEFAYDLQGDNYISVDGSWSDANANWPFIFDTIPANVVNPQAMAAAASY